MSQPILNPWSAFLNGPELIDQAGETAFELIHSKAQFSIILQGLCQCPIKPRSTQWDFSLQHSLTPNLESFHHSMCEELTVIALPQKLFCSGCFIRLFFWRVLWMWKTCWDSSLRSPLDVTSFHFSLHQAWQASQHGAALFLPLSDKSLGL